MKPPCPGLRYYLTTEKNNFNYAKSYKCMVFIHLYDSVKNFIKMGIFLQYKTALQFSQNHCRLNTVAAYNSFAFAI